MKEVVVDNEKYTVIEVEGKYYIPLKE